MGERNDLYVRAVFGDTNRADGVPDSPGLEESPVYLEGRLVLSLSFQGPGTSAHWLQRPADALERYRLWDDLSQEWYNNGLELLRFEQADVVVRVRPHTAILWVGAVDTKARVIPEPDLDEAGMKANATCNLRWKRCYSNFATS